MYHAINVEIDSMTWQNIDGIFLPNHRCGCGSINIKAALYRTERLARMLSDKDISPIELQDLQTGYDGHDVRYE